jgi:SAM-dependent methyltransferase
VSDSARWSDDQTLAFYDREAEAYAGRRGAEEKRYLIGFLDRVPAGGAILDLGCGGGQDSHVMLAKGFAVTPLDGSAGLAAIAERRIGRPVRVMRFEDIEDEAAFDAIWANASLLHVPLDGLPDVLAKLRRALRPGGLFYAGYKAGDGGGRDRLGRFFNFPSREVLERLYADAGPWTGLEIRQTQGGGYDGEMQTWLHLTVIKPI